MAMALQEQQQAIQRRGLRPVGQQGATVGAMAPNNPVLMSENANQQPQQAGSPWTAAAQRPAVQPIGQASGAEAFGGPPITTVAPTTGPSPWSGNVPDVNAAAQQPQIQPIGAPVPVTQPIGQPSPWNLPSPVGQASAPPSALTPFTATDNLRATQINPVANERLRGVQSAVDSAARALAGATTGPFQNIGAGSYDPASDTQRARQLTGQGLESLYSGPNRQELAGNTLSRFIEDQNLDYARRAQDVGRQAASLGRLGSGMTADDIVRLGRGREENIVRESARLADETAGQELADRLNRLGASQGAFGQFAGQDVTDTGVRTGLRNEARGERGARQDFDQTRFGNTIDRLGALSGLEDQQFNQGLTQRNELRGERGYQGDLAQQAISNRFGQLDREQQAQQQAESQRLQRVGMASGTGFSNQPYGETLVAANGIEGAGRYGLDVAGNYAQELGQAGEGMDWGSILRSLGIGGGNAPSIPQTVTDQAATIPNLPRLPQPTAQAPQLTPEQLQALLRYYNG